MKDVSVTALDALAASHMKVRGLVVTTPNMEYVPEYPMNEIRMHDDGSWGLDDYAWWPQLDCNGLPHHPCIPARPGVDEATQYYNDRILWHTLQQSDIVISDQRSDQGDVIGFLKTSILDNLSQTFELCAGQATKLCKELSTSSLASTLERLTRRSRAIVKHLKVMQYDCKHLSVPFRDLQRHTLELAGFVLYAQEVIPRMRGCSRSSNLLRTRGSFTMDAGRAEELFRLGIPVWYIRSESTITNHTKIFRVVDREPCSFLSTTLMESEKTGPLMGISFFDPKSLRSMSVYEEEVDMQDLLRLKSLFIGQWTNRNLPPPHLSEQAWVAGNNARPTRPLPSRGARHGKPKDITSSAQVPYQAGAQKSNETVHYARSQIYLVPISIKDNVDLPRHHPVIESLLKRLGTVKKPDDFAAVYFFPPPFTLVHKDDEKTARLYHCYLHIRKFLRKSLQHGNQVVKRAKKVQAWQDILHGNFGNNSPLPSGTASSIVENLYETLQPSEDTRGVSDKRDEAVVFPGKKRRRVERAAIKVTFGAEGNLPSYSANLRPIWRGKEISIDTLKLDHNMRREIQWEINETNFRMELWGVDAAVLNPELTLNDDDRHAHYSNICKVYGEAELGKGKYCLLPIVDKGIEPYISDDYVSSRTLAALQAVLSRWPGCPQDILNIHGTMHTDGGTMRVLLSFYVEKFVEHYKRVPCLPCRVPSSLRARREI